MNIAKIVLSSLIVINIICILFSIFLIIAIVEAKKARKKFPYRDIDMAKIRKMIGAAIGGVILASITTYLLRNTLPTLEIILTYSAIMQGTHHIFLIISSR